MRQYFKGVKSKEADGWMLADAGLSNLENEDYIIDTHGLHGDEVPEVCNDAKTFSQLVAGLLNCYYNKIETKDKDEVELINIGTYVKKEVIPSEYTKDFFDDM